MTGEHWVNVEIRPGLCRDFLYQKSDIMLYIKFTNCAIKISFFHTKCNTVEHAGTHSLVSTR